MKFFLILLACLFLAILQSRLIVHESSLLVAAGLAAVDEEPADLGPVPIFFLLLFNRLVLEGPHIEVDDQRGNEQIQKNELADHEEGQEVDGADGLAHLPLVLDVDG